MRHAFERDAAISERARAELDMGKVAEFVWTAMLMGIKRDESSCETAAISERARAELDMGKVAEFVWTAMLMGIKRDESSCETLFALVELALY